MKLLKNTRRLVVALSLAATVFSGTSGAADTKPDDGILIAITKENTVCIGYFESNDSKLTSKSELSDTLTSLIQGKDRRIGIVIDPEADRQFVSEVLNIISAAIKSAVTITMGRISDLGCH